MGKKKLKPRKITPQGGSKTISIPKALDKIYHLEGLLHSYFDEETQIWMIPMPYSSKLTTMNTHLTYKDQSTLLDFLEHYLKIEEEELYVLFRRTYSDARAKPRFNAAMDLIYDSARIKKVNGMIIYYKYIGGD